MTRCKKGLYKTYPVYPPNATFYKDPINPNYKTYCDQYWPRTNGSIGRHVLSGHPYYSPYGNN